MTTITPVAMAPMPDGTDRHVMGGRRLYRQLSINLTDDSLEG